MTVAFWREIWEWIDPWLPSFRIGLVLSVLGVMFGPLYKSWVEKSVQGRFDRQIEHLRSQLRQDEEASKASARRLDEQFTALRSTVLSNMTSRQASFDKRRVEAIDKFWFSVIELRPLKSLLMFTQVMKMDEIMKTAAGKNQDGEAMRKFLTMLWDSHGLEKIKDISLPDTERPYLSPLTWAIYSVYRQILYYPFSQIALGRLGVGAEGMKDASEILASVTQILPHQKSFVDNLGVSSFPYLIEECEQLLLEHLLSGVTGQDADKTAMDQARDIISSINRYTSSLDQEFRTSVPEQIRKI